MTDRILTDGSPVPADNSHTVLRPDGQQVGYVVLTEEEREKGFVKPVRRSYIHSGPPPLPEGVRDLTEEEKARWNHGNRDPFVKYLEYPPGSASTGKFFTRSQVERAGMKKCGSLTTMALSIAETYAREPGFYGGTFCCGCGEHFPLNEFTWEPDGEPMDPALQKAWHAAQAEREAAQSGKKRADRIAILKQNRTMITEELKALGAE